MDQLIEDYSKSKQMPFPSQEGPDIRLVDGSQEFIDSDKVSDEIPISEELKEEWRKWDQATKDFFNAHWSEEERNELIKAFDVISSPKLSMEALESRIKEVSLSKVDNIFKKWPKYKGLKKSEKYRLIEKETRGFVTRLCECFDLLAEKGVIDRKYWPLNNKDGNPISAEIERSLLLFKIAKSKKGDPKSDHRLHNWLKETFSDLPESVEIKLPTIRNFFNLHSQFGFSKAPDQTIKFTTKTSLLSNLEKVLGIPEDYLNGINTKNGPYLVEPSVEVEMEMEMEEPHFDLYNFMHHFRNLYINSTLAHDVDGNEPLNDLVAETINKMRRIEEDLEDAIMPLLNYNPLDEAWTYLSTIRKERPTLPWENLTDEQAFRLYKVKAGFEEVCLELFPKAKS